METENIEYLIGRLELIKDHVKAGNNHMAIAKLLADISALKSMVNDQSISSVFKKVEPPLAN